MSGYAALADLTVGIHVGYVAFVVLGQLAIWIGWACGWNWIRNPWFRGLHLLAIAIVALEEFMNWRCPLTIWEESFRELAGQTVTGETFLGRLLHSLIFIEGTPEFFFRIHVGCAVVVAATFVLCPPRWHRRPGRREIPENRVG